MKILQNHTQTIWLAMVLIVVALLQTIGAVAQQAGIVNFTSAFSTASNSLSGSCKNDDANADEGDDFRRLCTGYASYRLVLYGFEYHINYSIENSTRDYALYLQPLEEDEESSKYNRADLYDQKLGTKIEWRLADGKPFAVIVHVLYYKNTGSANTFANPKNKVAEFVFVRGLKGYEGLKYDLPTVGTAYNPDEQAHLLADKFFEARRR